MEDNRLNWNDDYTWNDAVETEPQHGEVVFATDGVEVFKCQYLITENGEGQWIPVDDTQELPKTPIQMWASIE